MKISIIIPAYNCEGLLSASVNSVMNQTYSNWQLILVDDGSTDNTPSVCDTYAKIDERITVVHIPNNGPANARNIGLDRAIGDYCMFIDSDDYIESDTLEVLTEVIHGNDPEIVFYPNFTDKVVGGNYEIVKSNIRINETIKSNQDFIKKYRFLSENGYIHPVWNKIYKLAVIKKNEAMFPSAVNVSEDYIFNLKLYKNLNKAVIIDKPLYHYVSRDSGSITSSFNSNRFISSKQVYIYAMAIFKNWNSAEIHYVENAFITDINICVNNLYNEDCPWGFKKSINLYEI